MDLSIEKDILRCPTSTPNKVNIPGITEVPSLHVDHGCKTAVNIIDLNT